ncbi:fungal hydrophobin [Cerioporus squamosus]|nr:fungal hydrophobin [Cerioporus squamosus]
MFSHAVAITSVLSLALLAAASPHGEGHPTTTITVTGHGSQPTHIKGGTCGTGPVQCCNQVKKATDPSVAQQLGAIGVAVQGVDALVGIDCTPVSAVGVLAGNSCKANAVCCQDNNFGGAVAVGCVPISA